MSSYLEVLHLPTVSKQWGLLTPGWGGYNNQPESAYLLFPVSFPTAVCSCVAFRCTGSNDNTNILIDLNPGKNGVIARVNTVNSSGLAYHPGISYFAAGY